MTQAAAVKQKSIAQGRDLKPSAENAVPAQRTAHREAKLLGGNVCCIQAQHDGTARLAPPLYREGFPSRPDKAPGGQCGGQISE